jgi:hypothetical protein
MLSINASIKLKFRSFTEKSLSNFDHTIPNRLTAARSCQFGRASAPIVPQLAHTIRGPNAGTGTSSADQAGYFLGPSILLSTIFRASSNAPTGVENGIVSASLSPSSSYIVTMKPAWRVRSRRWKL